MSPACEYPDASLGVAIRLSSYLDCQARVLGENGFQALAGGPLGASLLSGLLAIFIGLIGYRLVLGNTPGIRDGVGWTIRVGFVLALVTSWPAFQTLVYRVAVDGPNEVAAILLPATGLPSESLDGRVQQAYDTIRLGSLGQRTPAVVVVAPDGSAVAPPTPVPVQANQFQAPMPQTASLFVLTTTGFIGAFRIGIGFLLAVAPLAILALLFNATLGIFAGWIRILGGLAFASIAAILVTVLNVLMVESELAHIQAARFGGLIQSADPQALTTIVIVFALVAAVSSFGAARMTSAFSLRWAAALGSNWSSRSAAEVRRASPLIERTTSQAADDERLLTQARTAAVADALAANVRREQAMLVASAAANGAAHSRTTGGPSDRTQAGAVGRLGNTGRRTLTRRTRSAARRDMRR